MKKASIPDELKKVDPPVMTGTQAQEQNTDPVF